MPIHGEAFIGGRPGAGREVTRLAPYDAVVRFAGRLQLHEQPVRQTGQFVLDRTTPVGVAVRSSAARICQAHPGLRAGHGSRMSAGARSKAAGRDMKLQGASARQCAGLERSP